MDIQKVLIAINEMQNAADKMRHFPFANFVDRLNGLWSALKEIDQSTLDNAASQKTSLLAEIENLKKQRDEAASSLTAVNIDLKANLSNALAAIQAEADALKTKLAEEQNRQIADRQATIANLQSTVRDLEHQKNDLEATKGSLENAINSLKKNFQQVSDSLNG